MTKTHPPVTKAATTAKARRLFPAWLLAALLALVTIALYWPVTGFDFLNYDDPKFVTANVHVQGGLNWEGVKWAFGLTGGDYWHPLTWLSLMLDASLFGQRAGGFHFTNVALHVANGVLLFLLLRMLTGTLWRSVAVAALFALHPLRVESVAWVAERKDVLSGCFGLLALICYARYAQRSVVSDRWSVISSQLSGASGRDHRSLITDHRLHFYLLSLFFYACGLMSKAMLVTWPFVMLLLDYWPLGRMQQAAGRGQRSEVRGQRSEDSNTSTPGSATEDGQHATRFTFHVFPLVMEKLPFFVFSGISCALTYLTESGRQEAVGDVGAPLLLRAENALVAYARYLGKAFWPVNLAVPYVNPGHWSSLEVGRSALALVGVCLVVLWLGRRRPYLLMGWCWFWGTMIPVIGLTRGWGVFMADRFTYVPSIGVLILTVWGAYELTRGWSYHRLALSVAGSAAIVLCLALTWKQTGYWRDSEALSRHALEATEYIELAHNKLGHVLDRKGQTDEALGQYQEALRFRSGNAEAHINLGNALDGKGQIDEAITQYQEAIRLQPGYAKAHYNLGLDLLKKGQIDEAITQYQEAIRLQPDYAKAHYNLGLALLKKGQTDEAISQYEQVIRLIPDYAEAHNNLGAALELKGQTNQAIHHFQEALRLKPGYASARKNLDAMLATKAPASPPPGAATNR